MPMNVYLAAPHNSHNSYNVNIDDSLMCMTAHSIKKNAQFPLIDSDENPSYCPN